MRLTERKTLVAGLVSAVFIVLALYFIIANVTAVPRAEATLDRVAVRLEAPPPVPVGARGSLMLVVDNRANRVPVRFRDILASPNLTELIRFDAGALREEGASLEGDRITWNREIPGGGTANFRLPFQASKAGEHRGALLLLFEVPRLTKGKSVPLVLEVR